VPLHFFTDFTFLLPFVMGGACHVSVSSVVPASYIRKSHLSLASAHPKGNLFLFL
jgi:hypothetical protein